MFLGHLYAMQGRTDDALAELERGYSLEGSVTLISVEGLIVALSSNDEQLQRWLSRAIEHQQPGALRVNEIMATMLNDPSQALDWLHTAFATDTAPEYYVAAWAAYFGDAELAIAAMQRAPDPWLYWMPVFQEVRQHSDFSALLVQIGLESFFREFGWNDYCQPTSEQRFACS